MSQSYENIILVFNNHDQLQCAFDMVPFSLNITKNNTQKTIIKGNTITHYWTKTQFPFKIRGKKVKQVLFSYTPSHQELTQAEFAMWG